MFFMLLNLDNSMLNTFFDNRYIVQFQFQEREMRQINETLKRTYMKMVSCGQQCNLSVVSEMVTQLTGRYLSSADQSVGEYQDFELLELDNNEPSDEPIAKRLRFI